MLLASRVSRRLDFVRPQHARVPLVPERGLDSRAAAWRFLSRYRGDALTFRSTLRAALDSCTGARALPEPVADTLMGAVAQRIAERRLGVGAVFPERFRLTFDDNTPSAEPFDAVLFAAVPVAAAFLVRARADRASFDAVTRAWRHDAGRLWRIGLSAGPAGPVAPDIDAAAAARLLHEGLLLVERVWPTEDTFRLAWRRPVRPMSPTASGGASAGAAPPVAAPADVFASLSQAVADLPPPRSILPDLPALPLPQVAALIAAAAAGVPFCEECAKDAAASAAGGLSALVPSL